MAKAPKEKVIVCIQTDEQKELVRHELKRLVELQALAVEKGIEGESKWQGFAYDKAWAALDISVESMPESVTDIPGIGDGIAQKVAEILETGSCEKVRKFEALGLSKYLPFMRIKGVGPVRAVKLVDKDGFKTPEEYLAQKAPELEKPSDRMPREEALTLAQQVVDHFKTKFGASIRIDIAGSLRRQKPSIRDIDIVIAGQDSGSDVYSKALVELAGLGGVIVQGNRKTAVFINGKQVEIVVANDDTYGATLLHSTGSADFNVAMRKVAISKGLSLSQNGVADRKTGQVLCTGKTEEEVFEYLGLEYVEPRNRLDENSIRRK